MEKGSNVPRQRPTLLRLCVKRFGRLPTAITVDGGPEFKSVYFEQLLALYKVRKHQRPAAEPRFGSPLERLFGTMETEFIYHLLGNTQASKVPRTMTKATDPRRHAVWTLATLAERMQQWADEEYDTLRHPALGQSPREAYEQSQKLDGERDHKRIPYDETFRRATFPTTDRGQGRVQPGKGVRMNYLDYWCDEMRDREVERTRVAVRYDPFDVTTAYAFVRRQWRKCIGATDDLVGCSERELQILAEELHKRNRLQYGREQVEITQKHLADFRRENAAQEVILRQQRHDRETRAAFLLLEGGRGTRPVPGPATSPPPLSPRKRTAPHDQADQPASTRSGQEVGDGDTLIVLRRIRS